MASRVCPSKLGTCTMPRWARLLWFFALLRCLTCALPMSGSPVARAGRQGRGDVPRNGAPRRNRGRRPHAPIHSVWRDTARSTGAALWVSGPRQPAVRGCMQLRGGGLFSSTGAAESKCARDAREAHEAAVAKRNEELEKVLECPACLNLLYQPITLLCGHSFCGVCLKSWLRSGSRICPMCRAPVEAYMGELHTSYALASTIRTLFPDLYEQRLRDIQDAQYFPPKGSPMVEPCVWV